MDDIYYAPERIPRIDKEVIRRLSRLNPWRSLSAIVFDWIIILTCIAACEYISYWLYPIAFVIVGSRFHGLEAMMHEATHYRLHPNRAVNEIIGELSVWPLGLSLYLYRNIRHFSHHKNIGTVRDSHLHLSYRKYAARFNVPKPISQLLKSCATVAISFPVEIWWGQLYTTARILPRFSKVRGLLWILFQLIVVASVTEGVILYGWHVLMVYILFFVLPLMWVAVFSRYLRLLTEHFGIPAAHNLSVTGGETRTALVRWPVRIIFWPHLLNYHLEHHWYPSVPFYNLPYLHRLLMSSPEARDQMHVTQGIGNLIRELTGREPSTVAAPQDVTEYEGGVSTAYSYGP